MILCYITDRSQLGGDIDRLLAKISEAIAAQVDYIQLREKDLPARTLEELALSTKNREPRTKDSPTRILINSRVDVALSAGAHGVHLPANEIRPSDVRKIWQGKDRAIITVSCHSAAEVSQAAAEGADLAIFGPVFEKSSTPPQGLDRLHEACRGSIPVLALGGVTLANAQSCLDAGAAGIAAIRLFQENNGAKVVAALRGVKG